MERIKKMIIIRVLNNDGDQIELSPQTKSALENLGLEADKPNIDWDELTDKMMRVLQGDNFDVKKLKPEVSYMDTKEGKKITQINITYSK